jgi:DNA repair exonuclease SbcCD ATPase subunit
LTKLINEYDTLQTNINKRRELYNDLLKDIGAKEESIKTNRGLYESMQRHEAADAAINLYSKLVNTWLPEYLYEQARETLNAEFAKFNPPNDLTIRLSNKTYGTLVLIDRDEYGNEIERDIRNSGSGLESAIAVILLSNALRNINEFNKLKFIMIDEVSGPLHTGTPEDPTNWLEYFETLVQQIAKDNCLLMIDQRIDHNIFTRIIELSKEPITGLTVLAK